MEFAILGALAIIAILLVALLLKSNTAKSPETPTDDVAIAQIREENIALETKLQSTQSQLDQATLQLATAQQLEIEKASLQRDLANEQALSKRYSDDLNTAQSNHDQLQSQTQKQTGEISGLKAELDARNKTIEEQTAENSDLRKQTADLTDRVNDLTAKTSNLNTQLENAEERLVERGQLEKLFGDRFKTMSTETLANQQKQFLERATETLKPLSQKVDKLDREWATTSGAFKQQVNSLADQTKALSTALSKPQGRGQWGEIQVERVLEFSGLQAGIHYEAQAPDMKGGRTDFIVHMPHDRDIILDSKVPLVAYVDAHDTDDENERNAHLERFARHFQDHVNNLASKEYWSDLPKAADYVVMVVPDYALPEAVARRPSLIDEAHQQNVVISSQSNLVALLKTVSMGWQERQLADEAFEIGQLGRDLHDRLEVFATTHYAGIGRHLQRAVGAYNDGVGSLESRVLTQARRFPELGVQTTRELTETQPVETTVRAMRSVTSNEHPGNESAS